MKTELVRFNTTDGLNIQGLLFTPDTKTDTVVIHVHGAAGNFYENKFIDDFAKCFTDLNMAFFPFNNRGSEYVKEFVNTAKNNYEIIGMLNESFEDCVKDIDSAIEFVKSLGYKNIILQGHSLGCNKVVYYTLNKNFKGKIILLAPCDLAREIKEKDIEKAKELISLGKGRETIPNFWGTWNISANSLITVWSSDANSDFFRYRDYKINKDLLNLRNESLIEIGTEDSSCVANFNIDDMISYLKKSLKNSKLKIEIIKDANHHFKHCEDKLMSNIKNFLK